MRIRAYLALDAETVTLYESELFEKDKNPVSRSDLRRIRQALHAALERYEEI